MLWLSDFGNSLEFVLLLYELLLQWFSYIGTYTTPLLVTQINSNYSILGWSGLSGVLVVLVAFAINYPLARYDISVGTEVLFSHFLNIFKRLPGVPGKRRTFV